MKAILIEDEKAAVRNRETRPNAAKYLWKFRCCKKTAALPRSAKFQSNIAPTMLSARLSASSAQSFSSHAMDTLNSIPA